MCIMNTVGAFQYFLPSKIYQYVLSFKSSKLCSLDSEVSQKFAQTGKNILELFGNIRMLYLVSTEQRKLFQEIPSI